MPNKSLERTPALSNPEQATAAQLRSLAQVLTCTNAATDGSLIYHDYPWVTMWPTDFDDDHEYQLAMEIRGRGARRQLDALEALMGHALSRPELAKRIQGTASAATVTKAIRALDQKGLVRVGLMPDLKTQRIELSALGARVLLVSQQMLPDAYRRKVTERGLAHT